MKKSRWSPADLDRQRRVVRRIVRRSELDRLALAAARARLGAAIHNQVSVPLALAGCFVVGLLVVPRKNAVQPEPGVQQRGPGRLRQAATLLRSLALAVPAYSAVFGAPSSAAPEQ